MGTLVSCLCVLSSASFTDSSLANTPSALLMTRSVVVLGWKAGGSFLAGAAFAGSSAPTEASRLAEKIPAADRDKSHRMDDLLKKGAEARTGPGERYGLYVQLSPRVHAGRTTRIVGTDP